MFYNQITGQAVEPTDWQLQLKPGDYYLIDRPTIMMGDETHTGPNCYGHIIGNTPDPDEPAYPEGFFLVRAYSQWCPKGELGLFCIVEATRQLTEAEFEAFRAQGWPTVTRNE